MITGAVAASDTGAKSFSESYGSFEYRLGFVMKAVSTMSSV